MPENEVEVKGIIFNLLEDVIGRKYGADTWDSLLDAASLQGSYTSLGNYPDEDLMKLVFTASSVLNTPADDIIRWFGQNARPALAQKYPQFFQGHPNTRSFLLTLNDVIHSEVRKLYPGAEVPVFDFDTSFETFLMMSYQSRRRLCALAEGFIQASASYYGEHVGLQQTECMKRGDQRCMFKILLRQANPHR